MKTYHSLINKTMNSLSTNFEYYAQWDVPM
jgi:hypothetical protein